MTMLRPKGKAYRIAEKVVPGLKSQLENSSSSSSKPLPKDELELKIIEINEHRGRPMRKREKQGYNARLDESLGARRGAERKFKQSLKARRDESKGMEKASGRRAYSAVKTMDKGSRKRRK